MTPARKYSSGTASVLFPVLVMLLVTAAGIFRGADTRDAQLRRVSADTTFAATVERLSESPGYFDSDNLISNETSYLHAVSYLRAAGIVGGAFIGVGPDQNFSYIAAIRPSIAYIVDIRRDNLLLHLMFKALFQRSRNRLEYLCRWLGRPVPPDVDSWTGRPISAILSGFDRISPDSAVASAEADTLIAVIATFGLPISGEDSATIRRFHHEFASHGLELRFTSKGRSPRYYYPTLRQLILELDLEGNEASYLASEAAWRVVRDLQIRNRIIPVVGDLAGSFALHAIGQDAAARGEVVSAFYVSNVENYLWRSGTFPQFAVTTAHLPRSPRSVMIRSFFGGGFGQAHPLNRPPYYSTQLVQTLDDFSRRQALGWSSYWELITEGNRIQPPEREWGRSPGNDGRAPSSYR